MAATEGAGPGVGQLDLEVPVSWGDELCGLSGGLPVELRGFKWGSEPAAPPEEDQPSWPEGDGSPGVRSGPANGPALDGHGPDGPDASTTTGQASQWWPEAGHSAGTNGPDGHGSGAAGARWGISSESGADSGSAPSPSPGSALERSGYSYGQHSSDTRAGGSMAPWSAGGRSPVANGRAQPGAAQRRPGQPERPQSVLRRAWQRFITALAAVGAFLAKFGALLLKVKYVGLVLSMLVSVVAYSLFFGWSFAVGIVLLILVHEMGHVIELRRQGVPASAPLFIPFLGAFVNMKGSPRSAYQEALSGLAGPLTGTAVSVVVAFWANATGSKFLMALAFFGFFVNLFNLLPVLPLDGGRAAAALHPVLWLLGLVALLAFEFIYPSPVIPIVLILGGMELWRRWRYRNSPASKAYNALFPQQRLVIGAFYVALVAVTIVGAHATYVARSL
jgi:Zn-dependent protease